MKDETLRAKKYLLFSMTNRKTGVDNVFRMLNLIFKEARLLGRIPAIGKFTMSPFHNLGDLRDDLCFDDYLDLSNSKTYKSEHGHRKQIASQLDWIKEEGLDVENYTPDKVYTLAPDEIVTEEMNQRYDVLIRRNPTFKYVQTCAKYKFDFLIDFSYSQKVNQLTDEVLDVMGISCERAMEAQHYFLNKVYDAQYCKDKYAKDSYSSIFLEHGYYACMHVRASINDRDYEQPIFTFASSKTQVTTVLNEAISKGSVLYIMSDIHQADFFDFLKIDYQVYRYYDFPNLKKLVTSEDKIDNIMLYLVEKNIMKHATVKILPPHKAPMVYHLNAVYDLSLLKEPPKLQCVKSIEHFAMKDETLRAKKYLLFSMTNRKTGVDNVFRMLNLIFKEARLLGRIPAIGKFTMSPFHNLGDLRDDLCFDDYLDLSNSKTYKSEHGHRKQIASQLDWIKEEGLDVENYTPDKVYTLAPDEIVTEEMNQRYDVLIRRNPTFKYVQTCAKYKFDFLIDFSYSQKVNQLTDEVLDVMGISCERAMEAQHYFLNKVYDAQYCKDKYAKDSYSSIFLEHGYYACMHVRTSDRNARWPIFVFSSEEEQTLSMLRHTLNQGSKLYIMSDAHQADFFDFLKPDYQIYRYHDFPRLQKLVSDEDDKKTDNVMLYLVEKNIMKHATVKILPPHKAPMIYHLNTLYDLSLLKEPPLPRPQPHKRPRPTKFQKFLSDCTRKLRLKDILSRKTVR